MANRMDVIGAHARRLPPLDSRWEARPHTREELARGLLEGRVAGRATHPLDNVRGNILLLIEGDPDKQFGLSGLPGGLGLEQIIDLVADGAGAAIDHEARFGAVQIEPEPIIEACEAVGDRLARACAEKAKVVLATGHPIGLALYYQALARLLSSRGAEVLRPARDVHWRERRLPHDWFIDYMDGVAMLTDGTEPRHTHRPDAMNRILDDVRPDLVLGDHGFAGAAIESGIETVSVADVNDPALLVAKALGRTDLVVVMDDHVDPAAYWPCFQAIASAF
jgi:hypothetical protein